MNTIPLQDTNKMPFGMHRGKQLSEVPDKYLLWVYENPLSRSSEIYPRLWAYLEDNLEAFKENCK